MSAELIAIIAASVSLGGLVTVQIAGVRADLRDAAPTSATELRAWRARCPRSRTCCSGVTPTGGQHDGRLPTAIRAPRPADLHSSWS